MMWEDTHARLSIDENRTYLAGFSGGARVAISLGYSTKGLVAGVIACGGGLPSRISPSTPLPFVLYMTAGIEDFNNPEMQSLARMLEGSPTPHHLAVFEGGHEWLPPELAIEAIEWLELQAMRTNIKVKDQELIERLFEKASMQAHAAEAAGELYSAYSHYAGAAQAFQGLHNVTELQQKAASLKSTKAVREALKQEKSIGEAQTRAVVSINSLIARLDQSENKIETESELNRLIDLQKKAAEAKQASPERLVARRVLDSVFIGAFEQASTAIFQKDYQTAIIYFSVGTEIQPNNARTFFHLARAYALAKENRKALDALQTAAKKGFRDIDGLGGPEFVRLREEKRFNEITETVKNNQAGRNHPQ